MIIKLELSESNETIFREFSGVPSPGDIIELFDVAIHRPGTYTVKTVRWAFLEGRYSPVLNLESIESESSIVRIQYMNNGNVIAYNDRARNLPDINSLFLADNKVYVVSFLEQWDDGSINHSVRAHCSLVEELNGDLCG